MEAPGGGKGRETVGDGGGITAKYTKERVSASVVCGTMLTVRRKTHKRKGSNFDEELGKTGAGV